jgi:hypothetical protein
METRPHRDPRWIAREFWERLEEWPEPATRRRSGKKLHLRLWRWVHALVRLRVANDKAEVALWAVRENRRVPPDLQLAVRRWESECMASHKSLETEIESLAGVGEAQEALRQRFAALQRYTRILAQRIRQLERTHPPAKTAENGADGR